MNQRFPSRVENVIACGRTGRKILNGVTKFIEPNSGEVRCKRVGPLATDTSFLNSGGQEQNWQDLSKLVQHANKKGERVGSCAFIDCRQIEMLNAFTTEGPVSEESCHSPVSPLEAPLETIYLVSAHDDVKNEPIAPVYLLKANSYKDAILRFLGGARMAELNVICISKCDRILNLEDLAHR